jgi:sulfatase maturation enzyme AslB (radical SAM superfamily)
MGPFLLRKKMLTMIVSCYLRTRERDGRLVIFHELHPDPVYSTVKEWHAFLASPSKSDPLFDKLYARKLLVGSSEDDDQDFAEVSKRLNRKLSKPTILYLLLAQGCNFSCTYCPVPGLARELGDDQLTPEDARAGLELWSRHLADDPPEECYIIFYGGEPLLNKPTFSASLKQTALMQLDGRLPISGLRLMLATNGSLIDDATIDACLAQDVLVAIGLDGPRQANDRYRMYADGRGSFDDILCALRRLRERGVRTAVSATMTPASIHEVDALCSILADVGISNLGINFLKGRAVIELVPESERSAFIQASMQSVLSRYRHPRDGLTEYQAQKKCKRITRGITFL